ncbi:Glyoxalase/bleomycin resistance protein/dioxygenase [Ferrimonas balearica DSM 9799]|uniref:Glyoxalase/bleomycin resistance protein/dioxygenase n=1 Tax=Ferrimonas balearica (strain DSM 9799 / CCM 4581 / KCTC 23876 / PAT) TaxID=550540 RepID=E1STN9_FERBD|nr:VOC family protein [Ferrimonas balearica]ADN76152.1 Glyoxalase/bleomycin resistance protein/dioxygenase [Ferrimonas balearica DSM 9799]MBY5981043.1 VOC family protein [Ferrimonas balearica]MBY6016637.1 VOC family protein [Halomonas denitrificans]
MSDVHFSPTGSQLNAYLVVDDAKAAMTYYETVFGAVTTMVLSMPDGRVGHAEMAIGDSTLMLADEFPDMGFHAPAHYGGTPVSFCLYVANVDAVYQRAVTAGAKALRPVEDQFYGDRAGTLEDPFGHVWTLATHKEDLTEAEIQQRFDEFLQSKQQKTAP